jgi:hypothetical protein
MHFKSKGFDLWKFGVTVRPKKMEAALNHLPPDSWEPYYLSW